MTATALTAVPRAMSLAAVSDANRSRLLLLTAIVALLGVADGIYLTLVHLDYETGRAGVATACHQFSATGCSITAGRFGDLGGIPVATLGGAGALATAVLAAIAWTRRAKWEDPFRQALVVLAMFSVGASVAMAGVSTMEGAWCPFCVAWYCINATLAWLAWRVRDPHVGWRDAIDDTLGTPAIVAAVVFGLTVAGTMQWYHARRDTLRRDVEAEMLPLLVDELRKKPRYVVDMPNAHRKGPDSAEVVIVEFGDFQCPHCAKLFHGVEQYAAANPDRVQVVFAHYPIGKACNPNVDDRHEYACGAAAAAECAGAQGKFWEYAEHLFGNQDDLEREDLREAATTLGLDLAAFDRCMVDPKTADRIAEDIASGTKIDLTATPTFLINGYKSSGALEPGLLAAVIDGLVAAEASGAPSPAAAPTGAAK